MCEIAQAKWTILDLAKKSWGWSHAELETLGEYMDPEMEDCFAAARWSVRPVTVFDLELARICAKADPAVTDAVLELRS
jgi:hypothetical protein